jgi:hypothetical protein
MLRHPPSAIAEKAKTQTIELPAGMQVVPKIPEPVTTEIPENPAMPVSANPELAPSPGDTAAASAAATDGTTINGEPTSNDALQRGDRPDKRRR